MCPKTIPRIEHVDGAACLVKLTLPETLTKQFVELRVSKTV